MRRKRSTFARKGRHGLSNTAEIAKRSFARHEARERWRTNPRRQVSEFEEEAYRLACDKRERQAARQAKGMVDKRV